jgi:hypothetical protein
MKSPTHIHNQAALRRARKPALLTAIALALNIAGPRLASGAANQNPGILPPSAIAHGKSYPEWVAAFWEWDLEYPLEGHPALEHDTFDLSLRQSGKVWFWSAPDFGERSCTMPAGTMLFLTLRDVECSSLEAPDSGFFAATEPEQRELASYWADHIVNVFCVIDGVRVENLAAYRFSSTQFQFDAPTPWIFGETGGSGTGVGDGYYLLLAPLSKGEHTIHYGGTFHFTLEEDGFDADFPKEITMHLKIE